MLAYAQAGKTSVQVIKTYLNARLRSPHATVLNQILTLLYVRSQVCEKYYTGVT